MLKTVIWINQDLSNLRKIINDI